MKSIEELLDADEHICHIILSEEWDFPEIDYSLIGIDPERAERILVTPLKKLLAYPHIVDDFEGVSGDREREKWVENFAKTAEKEGHYFDKVMNHLSENSLRRHKLSGIMVQAWTLRDLYQGEDTAQLDQLSQEISSYLEEIRHAYIHRPNQEKDQIAVEIKQLAYQVLQFLSKPESLSESAP